VALTSARIGVLDIETAPLLGYFWRLGKQVVTLDQVETDWSILSFCWKWTDEKELIYEDTGGRGAGKVRDDRRLMKPLRDLLDEADIVIAQNGKKFDIKKVNSRLIMQGFKPYSPIKIIDTLQSARNHFGFTSNKLQYLSEKLATTQKYRHNEFPGLELWKACLADNPKAWAVMRKYNPLDVIATAEVYETMRPWISNHPNLGAYVEDKEPRCPKCESKKLQARGYSTTQQGKYQKYQCMDCAGWARGKTTVMDHRVRRGLLANSL
jgi:hypothetical protein